MTKKEREALSRAVMREIALWEPQGRSIKLLDEDVVALREDIALKIAPELGIDDDRAFLLMDVARMSR